MASVTRRILSVAALVVLTACATVRSERVEQAGDDRVQCSVASVQPGGVLSFEGDGTESIWVDDLAVYFDDPTDHARFGIDLFDADRYWELTPGDALVGNRTTGHHRIVDEAGGGGVVYGCRDLSASPIVCDVAIQMWDEDVVREEVRVSRSGEQASASSKDASIAFRVDGDPELLHADVAFATRPAEARSRYSLRVDGPPARHVLEPSGGERKTVFSCKDAKR